MNAIQIKKVKQEPQMSTKMRQECSLNPWNNVPLFFSACSKLSSPFSLLRLCGVDVNDSPAHMMGAEHQGPRWEGSKILGKKDRQRSLSETLRKEIKGLGQADGHKTTVIKKCNEKY